ncbi:MAG TPA: hypothetical protein GX715_10890 [Armatimonadetes bacterium]|nr:hypothetical protein [Armatimonadota bacterium]
MSSRLLVFGVVFGIVGAYLLIRGLAQVAPRVNILLHRRSRRILQERLGKKSEKVSPAPNAPASVPATEGQRTLLPMLTRLLSRTRARPVLAQLDHALVLARIPLKAVEFLYITLTALFLTLAIVQFFTSNLFVALTIALLAGFAPFYVLRITQRMRFAKIDFQVADALLLMTNSLRSGTSFLDAMETVSTEMPPPISEEFERALRDVTLGVPVDEAFIKMSQRCRSEDLDLAVTAFMIQREVGGNLAEILENIAETIRMRVKLKREIQTLTAQGKLSGGILCALPLGLTVLLTSLNPDYMDLLLTTAMGKGMLITGAVLQVLGILAIMRVVKIEV